MSQKYATAALKAATQSRQRQIANSDERSKFFTAEQNDERNEKLSKSEQEALAQTLG